MAYMRARDAAADAEMYANTHVLGLFMQANAYDLVGSTFGTQQEGPETETTEAERRTAEVVREDRTSNAQAHDYERSFAPSSVSYSCSERPVQRPARPARESVSDRGKMATRDDVAELRASIERRYSTTRLATRRRLRLRHRRAFPGAYPDSHPVRNDDPCLRLSILGTRAAAAAVRRGTKTRSRFHFHPD